MQGDFNMFQTILFLTSICGIVRSSGVVPIDNAPVVTAASSQYFERTYNRLVAAPPVQPVIPVAPAPPVFIEPAHPVFVEPAKSVPVVPVNPTQSDPVQPNVAIAIATAQAAAPVATILLPPYPFGLPPGYGFVAPEQPINTPEKKPREPTTTTQSTTQVTVKTTVREPEATTPLPASSDNNFVQALPSNQNVGFKQYAPPQPVFPPQTNQRPQWQASNQQQQSNQQPQWTQRPHLTYNQPQYVNPRPQLVPRGRPQKLKTSVEIVPVPLAYIAPPPLRSHQAIKVVKHVHAFVPATSATIIIRPVPAPLRIRSVNGPVRLVTYRSPLTARSIVPQNLRQKNPRETEPTTFRPFPRPNTNPPKV